MLLHYLVVPGLGNGTRTRPEAAAVRGDGVAPLDCESAPAPATPAGPGVTSPVADTVRAA